jgi:hypothetical protein
MVAARGAGAQHKSAGDQAGECTEGQELIALPIVGKRIGHQEPDGASEGKSGRDAACHAERPLQPAAAQEGEQESQHESHAEPDPRDGEPVPPAGLFG